MKDTWIILGFFSLFLLEVVAFFGGVILSVWVAYWLGVPLP